MGDLSLPRTWVEICKSASMVLSCMKSGSPILVTLSHLLHKTTSSNCSLAPRPLLQRCMVSVESVTKMGPMTSHCEMARSPQTGRGLSRNGPCSSQGAHASLFLKSSVPSLTAPTARSSSQHRLLNATRSSLQPHSIQSASKTVATRSECVR